MQNNENIDPTKQNKYDFQKKKFKKQTKENKKYRILIFPPIINIK